MDVQQPEIKSGEPLPLGHRIYRHGLDEWIEKKKDKYIPSLYFFDLHESDKKTGYKLSVDWEKLATPEETIIRIGCSYKKDTKKFKKYENRVIYAIEVTFLNNLDGISDVIYNPIFHPVEKSGYPNNPAHSLIGFDKDKYDVQDRPAVITELRNHAQGKKIEFDMKVVDKAVQEYRNS